MSKNMTGFLIFTILGDIPLGGWHDFTDGPFASQQDAKDALAMLDFEYTVAQIVDLSTLDVVWEGHL